MLVIKATLYIYMTQGLTLGMKRFKAGTSTTLHDLRFSPGIETVERH